MSAYEPLAGVFAVALVGVAALLDSFLRRTIVESDLGLEVDGSFSPPTLGAFRGGAERLLIFPVNPGIGFGLMVFTGCFLASSSAFLLTPLSGDSV
jgi:hypothetical protein